MIEKGKIMSNESEVVEIFNDFFVTITDSLRIVENEDIVLPSEDIRDPIDQILFRFSRHPSIQKIRSLNVNIGSFSFEKVSVPNMKNEVDGLNPSKSTSFKSIPPKLLKNFISFHFIYLRRVALRQKPFFKGPSIKNFIIITRIPKKTTLI